MKPNFKVLDGLRGIAAVYVVINHCRANLLMGGTEYAKTVPLSEWTFSTKIYYTLLQATSLGREFVIFFFVLSGFSIAHSLTKDSNTFGFFKRRMIRLYPPYFLALAYAALVFYLMKTFAPSHIESGMKSVFDSFGYFLSNVFYIPSGDLIPQFWSLTQEVIFYFVIAFLFTRSLFMYYAVSILLYIVSCILNVNSTSGSSIITIFLLDYNIFFVVGITLYKNYSSIETFFLRSRNIFLLLTMLLFFFMVGIKFMLGTDNKLTLLLSALLSVYMLINFLHYNITNLFIHFIGKMSYTIYITHFASIYLYIFLLDKVGLELPFHTSIREWWIWIVGIVFCILLSVPLYFFAEKPTKYLLEKIRSGYRTFNA